MSQLPLTNDFGVNTRYIDQTNKAGDLDYIKNHVMRLHMIINAPQYYATDDEREDAKAYLKILQPVYDLISSGKEPEQGENWLIDELIEFHDIQMLVLLARNYSLQEDNLSKVMIFIAAHNIPSYNDALAKIDNLSVEDRDYIDASMLAIKLKN